MYNAKSIAAWIVICAAKVIKLNRMYINPLYIVANLLRVDFE